MSRLSDRCIRKKINEDTDEVKQRYFDGVVTLASQGVQYADKEVITRVHEWRIGKA
ncbi:hypothetical protein [Alteromonas halophila]|uniref:Uncharacterized protein n=1 Tax=Alteromonas halophila TaxID=516698 RepID=A0A918JN55_9ALTE|nr:hypothetical protein [Alteromonas halophila]GGW85046.1 hypothetical protein GCM10007391_18600 [Alteromonas halophila]